MRATPEQITAAERRLRRAEPRFAPVMATAGPCTLQPRRRVNGSHFEALARSITFQQLAGNAASAIWGRVRALVPGRFTPEAVLALSEPAMRGAGLSTSKAASIRDLAAHVVDGSVRLGRIASYDDEAVIDQLTTVRGIGRWTAEMFLMFRLGRIDVWPGGDLGVRKGFARIHELPQAPSERDMPVLGEPYTGFRSVAAWYCWRAVDTVVPD